MSEASPVAEFTPTHWMILGALATWIQAVFEFNNHRCENGHAQAIRVVLNASRTPGRELCFLTGPS